MHLKRLSITGVRNLLDVHIEPDEGLNYFFGDNGAGKTSLLEAISILSVGRSFRSGKITSIISDQSDQLTVTGLVNDPLRQISKQAGICRDRHSTTARIDGQNITRLSTLATAVPSVAISAKNHELIEGGPGERRNYLDWILFHVEPTFVHFSKRYRNSLLQRNAALRSGANEKMVSVWNAELAEHGESIAECRGKIVQLVSARLTEFAQRLGTDAVIPELQYRKGWADERSLLQSLEASIDNCRRLAATSTGPHRADVKMKVGSNEARYVHSRGQQKLLAILMKLVQVDLYTEFHRQAPILLFDDLPSELDSEARDFVFDYLHSCQVQVFLTGVEDLSKSIQSVNKMFHVNQGEIKNMVY